MRRAPVIGIVGHGYIVRRPYVDLEVSGTPHAYVDRVAKAGGRPLILPAGLAVGLMGLVDALILTGGGDLDPALTGIEPSRVEGLDVSRERDEHELSLVRAAHRERTPLLGVCRGLQVMVVAFGGTLVPDLGDDHLLPGVGHPLRTSPGSLAERLLGHRSHVTSLHHQAVADPGPLLRVTAWADDGVSEAVEWAEPGEWAAIGVQWHPELPDDATGDAVFGWLTDAACSRLGPSPHIPLAAAEANAHAPARTSASSEGGS